MKGVPFAEAQVKVYAVSLMKCLLTGEGMPWVALH